MEQNDEYYKSITFASNQIISIIPNAQVAMAKQLRINGELHLGIW